jgi:hypothetical protein
MLIVSVMLGTATYDVDVVWRLVVSFVMKSAFGTRPVRDRDRPVRRCGAGRGGPV